MNGLTEHPDERLEADPRWRLVQRVASSQRFHRAAQLRAFLVYVSKRALYENVTSISEDEIAIDVLGRRKDFNLHEDNIVRVQARQLRKRLDEYFDAEGKDEDWTVNIPKGSYVPEFRLRTGAQGAAEPMPPTRPGISTRLAVPILGGLLILSVAVSAVLWKRLVESKSALQSPPPVNPLWARVFGNGQQTNIVVGDISLVVLQRTLRSDISLEQYLSHDYPKNVLGAGTSKDVVRILAGLSARQYTGFGDLNAALNILNLSRRYRAPAVIRFARNLNIREMTTENFVMIGSRRAIPWNELFERQLRYVLNSDPVSGNLSISDKLAGRGGPVYGTSGDQNSAGETYAVAALVPNLGGNGCVLLLLGVTMSGAEGAAELLSSGDFPATIRNTAGCRTLDLASQSFEILIRTKLVAGIPQGSEVLTCRPVFIPIAAQK
ncbi:MAG: hypothetical protein ABSC05_22825 [Candidatus Solibacter sp.]|jgi:hypothetical protein